MARRRKPFIEEVEEFALRSIKRHITERDFSAVTEDFTWLGRFHETNDALTQKEKEDVRT